MTPRIGSSDVTLTAVDAFAGVGWGVACERLGIREYGADNAASVIRTRSANGMRTIYRDVWAGIFEPSLVPSHRMHIASPPCQTFSMAGGGEGRQALDDVLTAIDDDSWKSPAALHALGERVDPRTALVLTPLAHIWAHRPELVALEQVPPVLPIWRRIAQVLRTLGYSAWSGILHAEQYGVPQTRDRAILMARLDGPVKPPTPTHSRYYTSKPKRLDPGVEKWVSMAEALGWGMTERPYPTIATARETGGPDKEKVGGSATRAAIYAEQEAGRWVAHKVMGSGMVKSHGERPDRSLDQPSFTVRASAGGSAPGGFVWAEKWPFERPATTVVGSFSPDVIAAPGHRDRETSRQDAPGSVRVTFEEAAALQSFPPDFVWKGTKTARFQIVGNAVPPLMAEAILRSLLAPAEKRDAWSEIFAEVAG